MFVINKEIKAIFSKNILSVVLFFSWLKTLIYFYVFKGFRMLNYEQIEFIEKSFNHQNNRDKKLMNNILDFNRKRIKK
jgi:hypothetical protein